MNVKHRITSSRFAGGITGLILAAGVVVSPALAASGVTNAASAPTKASEACLGDWIAAQLNPSVTTYQAVGDCEISRRLDRIAALRTEIANTPALTADHRSTLTSILDSTQAGLGELKAKIDADTTLAGVRTDVNVIFTGYRVYVLVSRQVDLVRGDDLTGARADGLTTAAGKIQAAIDAARAQGKDVTKATKHLVAMQSAIAAAQAHVTGQAALVLPLTPAQWNAGAATPILNADRAAINAARRDLARAVREARAAVAALR